MPAAASGSAPAAVALRPRRLPPRRHPRRRRVGRQPHGVKVWENREYRNLDDTVELGTRNIKVALRRLRRFAREGAEDELDLDGTIAGTARNAGWLDIKMRPERHNKVKVLLFLDIGGSMDDHIKVCEELFSAAKSEFKHLEYFYFHNCIYDYVWKDNRRRHGERFPLWDVMHKYGEDYKVMVVGDATMSPYEILQPGGSVEYNNEEAGAVWLQRMLDTWPRAVWLNPDVKEAGEKLFRAKDAEAASAELASAPDDEAAKARLDELNRTASEAIEAYINTQALPVTGLTVTFDGASGVATVFGVAGDQASKEKILLCCGNVTGVSQVNDMMSVDQSEPEATFYTVVAGDNLSKIAKRHYDNAEPLHGDLRGQPANAQPPGQDLSRPGVADSTGGMTRGPAGGVLRPRGWTSCLRSA
jgi:hypothetical protein